MAVNYTTNAGGKVADIVNEIVAERGEMYKVYDIGNGTKKYVCRCKPIHFVDEQTGDWVEIDARLKSIPNPKHSGRYDCLSLQNRFTVGFREDGICEKTFGIRYRGKSEYQFETTPVQISFDGKDITLGTNYSRISKNSDYEFENQISDNVSILTKVHEVYVRPVVKVSQAIANFKIVERIDLTGFKITNQCIDGEYVPDANNVFYFEAIEGENMWIPQPIMWDEDGDTSYGIHHRIYKENGIIYYEKTPTTTGIEWLKSSTGTKYIDATNYYGNTLDGFTSITRSTWSSARTNSGVNSKNNTSTGDTQSYARAQKYNETTYICVRSWFWFDTSGIGAGNTLDSAVFYARGWYAGGNDVCIMKSVQDDTFANWTSNAFMGSEYGHVTWNASAYNSIALNSTGINDIEKTGTTKICLRERTHDYLDNTPDTSYALGGYYSDYAGNSYDPYLEITVSSAGEAHLFIPEQLGLSPLGGLF